MTSDLTPCFIKEITLQGFRAYLNRRTFDLGTAKCLAIFAPNGSGKSGLIDALEFMFSDTGTLDRLGLRAIHNNAGPLALGHNLAADRNIKPEVTLVFRQGAVESRGSREATGSARERPLAATAVKAFFTVDPIIRGHALRRFVEEHKAEDRYAEVARWLQLTPLVTVQKNLRALRSHVKADAESTEAVDKLDRELAQQTGRAVLAWDDAKVLSFINEKVLVSLDSGLSFVALSPTDPAWPIVKSRAQAEEQQVGLATLRQASSALASLYMNELDPEVALKVATGFITSLENGIAAHDAAKTKEAEERHNAASNVFEKLWKAAEPLFAEGQPDLDTCPLCVTPIAKTTAGSTQGIRTHVATRLGELVDYSNAKRALEAAKENERLARQLLIAKLEAVPAVASEVHPALKTEAAAYAALMKAGDQQVDGTALKGAIERAREIIDAQINDIETRQGDHTYRKAQAKIEALLKIEGERVLAVRTIEELVRLHEALNQQAAFISGEIRKTVQALLDSLRTPVNEIYAAIQSDAAVPVRLDLPAEDDTNQQRLNLLVDFAANRQGVQPSGFLSDSQIHSLALALRLAAIQRFNPQAPLIVMDDIVTSYDADHRRLIAGMIANRFGDFQIILTTHDERFFLYLKDQLPQQSWQYLRITRLERESGPVFSSHRVSDALIEKRWSDGESAANEMRQAEEEWLLAKCREFATKVLIRPVERAHSYERNELAEALATYLKDAGLQPQAVPGVANRFFESLQRGTVENFGSHFQDAQYGNGSIGDEKARWKEFGAFRDQFACPKCQRTKFTRPMTLAKPVCAHRACQTQFAFAPPPPDSSN
jgi:recombinational DNA repair ATPase RecF